MNAAGSNPRREGPGRSTLRARIALGLLGYTVLLTAAVFLHGVAFNKAVEAAVWTALLEPELLRLAGARPASEPAVAPPPSGFRLYRSVPGAPAGAVPAELADLQPGLHDDFPLGGRQLVVLVRDLGDERVYLSLDITRIEAFEHRMAWLLAASAVLALALLVAAAWWISGRLLRPVSRLAHAFGELRPDRTDQRLHIEDHATREEASIAGAMNDYLARQERFVRREREFIDTVSHELRTPLAVIAGAAEVMAAVPGRPPAVDGPLHRIRQAAADTGQLVAMLLTLAKEPARLAHAAHRIDLAELLPEIVRDHSHLAAGKDLRIRVGALAPATVHAPIQVLQVAIGNLLRNAIENSDSGVVDVEAPLPGVVRIRDPGHGMTPEEIGRLYAALARGSELRGSVGGGLGLELIRRLCEHLGWTLEIHTGDAGTTAELDLRIALAHGDADPPTTAATRLQERDE